MILLLLILILLVGGLFAWLSGLVNAALPRIVALLALFADAALLLYVYMNLPMPADGSFALDFCIPWITRYGISLHFALDGLSLAMLALTVMLGIVAVLASWKDSIKNPGFFHLNILSALAGIAGVFLSMDLFLFYFFWELMIIPVFFIIGIWGSENRTYAANKFFIFTQAGGLLMFVSILALYFIHGDITGIYTFNYIQLLGTEIPLHLSFMLMLGFLAGFFVKLPVIPFHSWLPDAYSEAPVAGSIILAGILSKTAAYGLLRFVVPLFPQASVAFGPFGMMLAVVSILYGAKLAFAQTDLKRLIAFSSISHMGFILLGVYAFNTMAFQGVLMQMIAHGISIAALFVIASQLQARLGTRDIDKMGGLRNRLPWLGSMGLVFALASLGMPGMGNFIAEFLILGGAFKTSILMSCLASLGLIAATLYSLRIVQKIFLGKEENTAVALQRVTLREKTITGALTIMIIFIGLYPRIILKTGKAALNKSLESVNLNSQNEFTTFFYGNIYNVKPAATNQEQPTESVVPESQKITTN
ncbi:MAG: NADH-quinone oxidoreductase subunit M [Bacteroidota bacterium]